MTTATPVTEAFEAHWSSAHGRSPLTWAALFDSSLQYKGQMPEDLKGVYFTKDAQKAWEAYQAATERAAKLCDEQADFHQLTRNTQAEQAAEGCAAAIRASGGMGASDE